MEAAGFKFCVLAYVECCHEVFKDELRGFHGTARRKECKVPEFVRSMLRRLRITVTRSITDAYIKYFTEEAYDMWKRNFRPGLNMVEATAFKLRLEERSRVTDLEAYVQKHVRGHCFGTGK